MTIRDTLADPIFKNNPIALQILGICSALEVVTARAEQIPKIWSAMGLFLKIGSANVSRIVMTPLLVEGYQAVA